MKKDLKTLTIEELTNYLEKLKYPKYHAKQIILWLHQRGVEDFSSMSDISLGLRNSLKQDFYISYPDIKKRLVSKDKVRKYLFILEDKNTIEAVLIPHRQRNTLCLSTQVGCRYACKFCASGALGFVRNLNQAEILNQIIAIKKDTGKNINNIVFMGIGEPLDNYDVLLNSIRIINARYGFNIGQRKITVSTVGLIDAIKKLSREGLQVELSVSLHSAIDEKRSKIIPINKKYPLNKLLVCLRSFAKLTKRKVTFEYILLGEFNTSVDDADRLISFMKGIDCKVNLIPFNPTHKDNFLAPKKLEVLFFRDRLSKKDVDVTIRQPRGRDIEAACGQLRLHNIEQNKELRSQIKL